MKTGNLIALLPIAMLVACGGGGGGDGGNGGGNIAASGLSSADTSVIANAQSGAAAEQAAPGPAFPVAAVLSAVASTPYGYVKTYTSPAGNVYTLVGEYRPGVILPFEGVSANSGFGVSSRRMNGTISWIRSQVDYYQTGTYIYLGTSYGDGEYVVANNQVQPPATARVGEKGSLYSLTGYQNNTKATVVHTGTASWEMRADAGSAAKLCVTTHLKYPDGRLDSSTTACNRVTASGLQSGSDIVISTGGNTETFTD
jgi:hypothetical protein